MKHIKRIVTLVLALMMTVSMGAVFSFATGDSGETTYTITINKNSTDKAAHTYGAYQIFTGRLETKDGTDYLSDVQAGSNITLATLITELNKIDGFEIASDATASKAAKAISDKNYTADSAGAQEIADAVNAALTGSPAATCTIAAGETTGTITGLSAGYYLVKDTAAVSGEGAQTRYILEVVKDVSVSEKADVPSVTKKVKEKNDTAGTETGWQDAADYDIGDEIPYQITGTLPGKLAEFDTYKVYKITDTLPAGLTAPAADDITVKLNGATDIKENFDVTVSGQVITVALKSGKDMKSIASAATDTVVVEYEATLNSSAVIGSAGNPNEVYLEFTNDPNGESSGGYGTTPTDKVTVFTYKVIVNKVDENKKALEGAGFTLYKKVNGSWTKVGNEITGVTTFEFNGIDAGDYKLEETTVPASYNKADDIEFTVAATYDTDAADPELKTLTATPADAFTCTLSSGEVSTDVVNEQGAVLPETGGMGTTIFYIAGSVLVIVGVVLLISRRRIQK